MHLRYKYVPPFPAAGTVVAVGDAIDVSVRWPDDYPDALEPNT